MSNRVSCVITGVSLANCDAVLIPLAPARYTDRSRPTMMGGARVLCSMGAATVFAPLTLPLHGRLGDVGRMNYVEVDPHTEFISRRLDTPITKFADAVAEGEFNSRVSVYARRANRGKEKNQRWSGLLSGCWVSRAAYDYFSTNMWDDCGKPSISVSDSGGLVPTNLKGIGFVKGAKDESAATTVLKPFGEHDPARYHTPWTHPELPDVTVWSDMSLSSKVVIRGALVSQHTIGEFQTNLTQHGFRIPMSFAWAHRTNTFLNDLMKARSLYRGEKMMAREWEKACAKEPQCHFAVSSETMDGLITEQTQCDGNFHVKLRSTAGQLLAWDVSRCPKRNQRFKCYGHLTGRAIPFTTEVWDELRVRGWQAPRRVRDHNASAVLQEFAPEMFDIYGGKLFGPTFRPDVMALMVFLHNMCAANRILTPTPGGHIYGYQTTQREVAQFALRLVGSVR